MSVSSSKSSGPSPSWGDSLKTGGGFKSEGEKSWGTSGSGSVQLHQPLKKDVEVQKATNRVAMGALDAFQNADQKIFSVLFGLYSRQTTVVYGD